MTNDLRKLWFDSPFAALGAAAARWPRSPFLEVLPETASAYEIEAGSITFAETLGEVLLLRRAYASADIRPGQRVGLMQQNTPAFFFHWFALNSLGASVVPLSTEWRATELEHVVAHSEMKMAVAPPERISDLADAARVAGRAVRLATDQELRSPSAPRAESDAQLPRDQELSASAECALLYTSGTTGRAKGCVLTNQYFVYAGQWYATIGGLSELHSGVERMLTPLPTTHMNAMAYSAMSMLLTGGCLIALDRFHPRTWWSSVREARASIVHYLGVMPAILLSAPACEDDRKHDVRFGFGAGVAAGHHAAFEERFGFPLLEAWAMTETGAGAVIIANKEPRQVGTACFGMPNALVEVHVGDAAAAAQAAGVAGELLVRAAGSNPRFGFFEGYLKDEEATAAAWEGGWFHTGDVVMRDELGALHFVDRKKNVIRRSGENVSAVEVEGALAAHPRVAAVGVVGVPDTVRGEEVLACVVADQAVAEERHMALAEEIVRFGLTKLAYFKVPGYVHFCAALPRTGTEKIQRGELRKLAHDAMAANLTVDTRRLKQRRSAAS